MIGLRFSGNKDNNAAYVLKVWAGLGVLLVIVSVYYFLTVTTIEMMAFNVIMFSIMAVFWMSKFVKIFKIYNITKAKKDDWRTSGEF